MKAFSNRYELKYILDWQTYLNIRKDIQHLFKHDSTAGKTGKYEVISVYYDTNDLDFFFEKINGEEQRIKIRLRTYKHNETSIEGQNIPQVFLEIKKKKNNCSYKKRAFIDEKIANTLFKHPSEEKIFMKALDNPKGDKFKELEYLKSIVGLKPKLFISYTREAFVSLDNLPVRITFDSNVKYRHKEFSLTRQIFDKHLLSPNHAIMEIKYTDYFPQWIVQIIQKYKCQAQTFSKYCIGMEHSLEEQKMLLYSKSHKFY